MGVFHYAAVRFLHRCGSSILLILLFAFVTAEVLFSVAMNTSVQDMEKSILSSTKGRILLNGSAPLEDALADARLLSETDGIDRVDSCISGYVTRTDGKVIQLSGNMDALGDSLHVEGHIELVSGVWPSIENRGALIPDEKKSEYGGRVHLLHDDTDVEIPVIGTYAFKDIELEDQIILCDYRSAAEVIQPESDAGQLELVTHSVEDTDRITEQIKSMKLNGNYTVINTTDSVIERALSSMEDILSISRSVLLIGLISAFIFILLIMLLQLKSYQLDIGVLLALGETKIKIWLRFLIELSLDLIAGYAISLATALFLGGPLLQQFFQSIMPAGGPAFSSGNVLPLSLALLILPLFLMTLLLISFFILWMMGRYHPRKIFEQS
ncbi:FtsX-like permease family protein [Candidatus Soleaferrea massiliensis]|uniref:FtsX-like permease family protein n=1 Tax=Candidatus Soleaferrea massiliensis TaxID=1470354 RepID=UPI00058F5D1F|nr:ABC transporter permease [Candidatus Soleaferrea massiliensis]